jgi:DNA-binding transcriptional ArsR family regulator
MDVTRISVAFSNERRIQIYNLIRQGRRKGVTIRDIIEQTDIDPKNIWNHMRILVDARMVVSKGGGRGRGNSARYFRASTEEARIASKLASVHNFTGSRKRGMSHVNQ